MADTHIAAAIDPVELDRVGKSWVQTNEDAYAWTSLIQAKCLDERAGRTGKTTYNLPDLENAMIDAGGLIDIETGETLPPPIEVGESEVTFTVKGRGPRNTYKASTSRPVAHRVADVEGNYGPMLMSKMYGGIEKDLAAFITNSANYGSGVTFQGTGALDTRASDQKPDVDIENALRDLRKYQGINGLELWCIVEHRVIDVLRGHPSYTGAGEGSNNADLMAKDTFLARFQGAHRIDKIIETKAVGNNVRFGQSASIREIAHEVLWFGIVDARTNEHDLTNQESDQFADGGLVLPMSRKPEILSGLQGALKEVELYYGKTSYTFKNPRGTSFGFFFASGEIFT